MFRSTQALPTVKPHRCPGPIVAYVTLQGPSRAISRLKDAQRSSQKGRTSVTSAEISLNEHTAGSCVTN